MIKPNEPILSFMACLMSKDSPFKTINLYYKAQKQYGRYSVFIKNCVLFRIYCNLFRIYCNLSLE